MEEFENLKCSFHVDKQFCHDHLDALLRSAWQEGCGKKSKLSNGDKSKEISGDEISIDVH
jgi:hypothetical protein